MNYLCKATMVTAACMLFSLSIAPVRGSDWISLNGLSGTDGSIHDIVIQGNDMYIGGLFTGAGKVAARNVAKWDGEKWSPLGAGLDSMVWALAIDKKGNLYAGGQFRAAGGKPAAHIARWDGGQWHPLGDGVDSIVRALECDSDGNVYAGGSFILAGEVVANYVAKWDGTRWHPLSTGVERVERFNSGIPIVSSLLARDGGDVYVAGTFDYAGGLKTGSIARWDGTKWDSLGPGLRVVNTIIGGMAFDTNGDLWVGGEIANAGELSLGELARWDGEKWNAVPFDNDIITFFRDFTKDSRGNLSMAVQVKSGTASSTAKVYTQEGTDWRMLNMSTQHSLSDLSAIAFDGNDNLYIGGNFSTESGEGFAYNIAKVDGDSICSLGAQIEIISTPHSISFNEEHKVHVSGTYILDPVNVGYETYICWYDENGWQETAIPSEDIIDILARNHQGVLYGAGAGSIYRLDDTAWTLLDKLQSQVVYAIVFDEQDNLYAGGSFSWRGDPTSCSAISKWDGTAWNCDVSQLKTKDATRCTVRDMVADSKGNIYVSGYIDSAGGAAVPRFARWDGSSWSSCGTGIIDRNSGISSLAVDDSGCVYVAGWFDITGGVNANNVVKWDGTSWIRLGAGMDNTIQSIAVDGNGICYAGGDFIEADGNRVNYLTRWNGVQWEPVGNGVNNPVTFLAVEDSLLYMAGKFTVAGDKASPYIAALNVHNPNTANIRKRSTEKVPVVPVGFRISPSGIVFDNVLCKDRISLYTMSGQLIYRATGKTTIPIAGFSQQLLLVVISRSGAVVAKGTMIIR